MGTAAVTLLSAATLIPAGTASAAGQVQCDSFPRYRHVGTSWRDAGGKLLATWTTNSKGLQAMNTRTAQFQTKANTSYQYYRCYYKDKLVYPAPNYRGAFAYSKTYRVVSEPSRRERICTSRWYPQLLHASTISCGSWKYHFGSGGVVSRTYVGHGGWYG